ncbi:MAG: hypothetical protein RLZ10_963, partial [Bacteroidota bacterium]
MIRIVIGFICLTLILSIESCDHVDNPYPLQVNLELDTSLYPGNWSDYVANEWPQFSPNTNTN